MQSTWENLVEYNLSESGVHPMTLRELVEDDGSVVVYFYNKTRCTCETERLSRREKKKLEEAEPSGESESGMNFDNEFPKEPSIQSMMIPDGF